MKVYAVVFGNYFPREVHSLWASDDAARKEAERLGSPWEVDEMEVGE